MDLAADLLRRLENHELNREARAELRCALAEELENAGGYEAARGALGDLWRAVGERPTVDDLSAPVRARVLLRAGALTGWLGSSGQVSGAQERAKDLLTEASGLFTAQ